MSRRRRHRRATETPLRARTFHSRTRQDEPRIGPPLGDHTGLAGCPAGRRFVRNASSGCPHGPRAAPVLEKTNGRTGKMQGVDDRENAARERKNREGRGDPAGDSHDASSDSPMGDCKDCRHCDHCLFGPFERRRSAEAGRRPGVHRQESRTRQFQFVKEGKS